MTSQQLSIFESASPVITHSFQRERDKRGRFKYQASDLLKLIKLWKKRAAFWECKYEEERRKCEQLIRTNSVLQKSIGINK
jgi:hypothetical protein